MKNKGKKFTLLILIAVFTFAAMLAKISAEGGKAAFAEDKGFYTVLVCGKDSGGRNTDVMMLASLDLEGGRMNILQIPRDTFVNPVTSGLGITRVNAVYSAEYARAKGTEREKEAMAALCAYRQSFS